MPKKNWDKAIENYDIFDKGNEEAIHVIDIQNSTDVMELYDNRLYPLLTAPIARKSEDDIVCPSNHIAFTRDFLSQCSKYLIIGTSGLDDDLLLLLDSAVQNKKPNLIQLINNHQKASDESWQNFTHKVKPFSSQYRMDTGNVFIGGFRKYLVSENFNEFLKIEY